MSRNINDKGITYPMAKKNWYAWLAFHRERRTFGTGKCKLDSTEKPKLEVEFSVQENDRLSRKKKSSQRKSQIGSQGLV
jgi:hypothetical protein